MLHRKCIFLWLSSSIRMWQINIDLGEIANGEINTELGEVTNGEKNTDLGEITNWEINIEHGEITNREINTEHGEITNGEIHTEHGEITNGEINTEFGEITSEDTAAGSKHDSGKRITTGLSLGRAGRLLFPPEGANWSVPGNRDVAHVGLHFHPSSHCGSVDNLASEWAPTLHSGYVK